MDSRTTRGAGARAEARLGRPTRPRTLLAAALAGGILLAGCGGASGGPPVAGARSATTATSVAVATSTAVSSRSRTAAGSPSATAVGSAGSGPPTEARIVADALAFARCMRAHGVPDYPDPPSRLPTPGAQAPGTETYLGNGPNPASPAVQAGDRACRRYAVASTVSPSIAAQVESRQLAYAQCMRAHRVPDFPDPSPTGGFKLPASVDESAPVVEGAERACARVQRLPPGLPGAGASRR